MLYLIAPPEAPVKSWSIANTAIIGFGSLALGKVAKLKSTNEEPLYVPNITVPLVPMLQVVKSVPKKLNVNPIGTLLQPPSSNVPLLRGTTAVPAFTSVVEAEIGLCAIEVDENEEALKPEASTLVPPAHTIEGVALGVGLTPSTTLSDWLTVRVQPLVVSVTV